MVGIMLATGARIVRGWDSEHDALQDLVDHVELDATDVMVKDTSKNLIVASYGVNGITTVGETPPDGAPVGETADYSPDAVAANESDDLHEAIRKVLHTGYMAHTTSSHKAAKVATKVLERVMEFYEAEAAKGAKQ